MARLSREVVAKRETRVKVLFAEGRTVKEVNDVLKAEFDGKAMRAVRLYQLRGEVEASKASAVPASA